MTASSSYDSARYFLDDHSRTLFPLTTSRLVVANALPELKVYLADILKEQPTDGFLPQQRCYSSKRGLHVRRTATLDPVAGFFVYDLVYRHRHAFRARPSKDRVSFGYVFSGGHPDSPSESYGAFRTALRTAAARFKHTLSVDVSNYFNSLYHHDLVEWFETAVDVKEHASFGRYLRECNRGRSIDCLPHGFHPCKAIGNAFLRSIDSSLLLKSSVMLRFMDDFFLFDNKEKNLEADLIRIQHLLGERGLSLNADKTRHDEEALGLPPDSLDDIKIELLARRRQIVVDVSGEPTFGAEIGDDEDELDEEQLEYLLGLLKNPDIDEADAELVLTVLDSHGEDLLEHIPHFLRRFPSLTRRIYSYSKTIADVEGLVGLLDKFVKTTTTATEDQLFWIAKTAGDVLRKSNRCPQLLLRVYEHANASPIVRAKVLEVPDARGGFQDLREQHLKGSSDWQAWGAIVGSSALPKGKRNQMLKYVGMAGRINSLVARAVMVA